MNLNKIFYPKSIAIIGASTREGTVGNDIVKNLVNQKFTGKIYPINPKTDTLYNLACYPSVGHIDDEIDLAIVVVPAIIVPEMMQEIANKNIKGVIIISAGFKEMGRIDLENKVKEICFKNDITLIGPNCLGVINPEIKMNSSFAMSMPNTGNLAFLSQSGALCTAVLDCAQSLGIGFSKFISVGNKACVDEVDFLEYFSEDQNTKVIAIYAEQLTRAQELIKSVLKLAKEKQKPIILVKAGKTNDGANASASHTGALGGSDAAYEALFKQSGIIRAESVSEFFDFIQVFTNNPLPQGNRVAIVTNAGGPGVLATDEAILNNLVLVKLSEETKNNLKQNLPEAANVNNPIDVLGDAKADRYRAAMETVIKDEKVDSVVVILTPQSTTEIEATAQMLIETKKQNNKPIVACFMGETTVIKAVEMMRTNGISVISFPEQAIKSLAALTKFAEITRENEIEQFEKIDVDKQKVIEIFNEARSQNITKFPEAQALKILEAYKFPLLKNKVATNANEASEIAKDFGTNLAMKIVSQDILHKSDIGGVILDIKVEEAGIKFTEMVEKIKTKLPNAKIEGVLLMEMAPKNGVELILGAKKDPALGQTIMVGLGGIYVEVFKDITFGIVPINKTDAKKMIDSIKVKKLFEGVRGGVALDVEVLIETLGRLSKLLSDFPEIEELDINPLLILPQGQGVKVLDARILI
ncbi:MAG: acetate--CoA ligase family protein [Candidatus Shapirobacteria bacterium]|jgi:acetyltransferase